MRKPISFNGHNINDGANYEALFPADAGGDRVDAEGLFVQRPGTWPVFAGKQFDSHGLALVLVIRAGSKDEIRKWFDPELGLCPLVMEEDGVQWFLMATVVSMVDEGGNGINTVYISLESESPYWQSQTLYSETWNVLASGDTVTVTTATLKETPPVLTITPEGSASAGYQHQRFVQVLNPTAREYEANIPIDLTGGGLDTAALVTAGKMQADGDDWRFVVDGVEVERWLGSMNTSASKAWVKLGLKPKIELVLAVAVPASGAIGELYFKPSKDAAAALARLPRQGLLVIDSERFVYSGVDLKTYKVAVTERASRDSSEAAHLVGAAVKWVQHDIWMLYGNAGAEAPDVDAYGGPRFNPATSNNGVWVFDDFGTYATDGKARPVEKTWIPGWLYSKKYTSYPYSDYDGAAPDYLGMVIAPLWTYPKPSTEQAALEWRLTHPAGFLEVSATGRKKRTGTPWATTCGLQHSRDGSRWTTAWNETSPVNAGSWTAFTRNDQAIAGAPTFLRFLMEGSAPGTYGASQTGDYAVEIQSVTVEMVTANLPQITVMAEDDNYPLSAVIANTTTGEEIGLECPMKVGRSLVVDCGARTVLNDGANAYSALTLLGNRATWLTLTEGDNELEITAAGTGPLEIVIQWREQKL